MEEYTQIEDIFVLENKEAILESEDLYVATLAEIAKKCLVLKKTEEAEAIPYLDYTCSFVEKLLELDNFNDYLDHFPKIKEAVMNNFLPKLAKIILRTQIFPDPNVLERTNRFYELMVLLSLRACQNGNQEHWQTIISFFDADKKFFRDNKNYCSLEMNPYGDPSFGRTEEFDVWVANLKVGDEVDAIKVDRRKTKVIWSRGIVEGIEEKMIRVEFLNEPDRIINPITHLKTPFQIQIPGTRTTDWEWRENLKEGDNVDAFIFSTVCAKNGWLACEVKKVIHQEDENCSYKIVDLEEINSGAPYRGTMNVHDPNLRTFKRFSEIGDLLYNFPNDDAFDIDRKNFFAITRVEGENKSHHYKTGYVHSKYFIKLINSFGRRGGFQLMEQLLMDQENWCPPQLTGAFMSIIAQCGEYLLGGFVEDYGIRMVDAAINNLLNAPSENVRDFTKEIVEGVLAAIKIVYKRTRDFHESNSRVEEFLLNIAMVCIKSDYLERKLHGVTILADLNSKLNIKEVTSMTKEVIAKRIQDENILTGIMKGHPQLITKSLSIFKVLFSIETITKHELGLLWNGLRKGDIDTKNSIIDILNDIYYFISNEHTKYFIDKMTETPPSELHINELEFAYNLVSVHSTTESDEERGDISNQVVLLLWNVATDDKNKNLELLKKATQNLILALQYCDNITVDQQIFDQAIENISNHKAVLQSLKVIKKMMGLKPDNHDMMTYFTDHNIIESIFKNLKEFKNRIRERVEKVEDVNLAEMKPDDLTKYMPDERYTFEKNILKRMKFIDFVISESKMEDDALLHIITQIWEELVMNSLIPIESILFIKWFFEFAGKIPKNNQVLSTFFYDKIQYLNDSDKILSKKELLKTFTMIFLRINLNDNKIEEKVIEMVDEYSSAYQTKTTEEKLYVLQSAPDDLDGIEALWGIIEKSDDDDLVNELIQFVTELYTTPEIDFQNKDKYREYVKSFIARCSKLLSVNTQDKSWDQDEKKVRIVKRVLVLLQTIVDFSQSRGLSNIMPLSSFFRGDLVDMTVVSKINFYGYFENIKKYKFKVYGNTTIHELKTKIATKIKKVSWKEIKIERSNKRKPIIKQSDNGRTLSDMDYSLGEIFTVLSNPIPKVTKVDLMMSPGVINPRAMEVFNEMYEQFAVEGAEELQPPEVSKFISVVLEDAFGPDSDRVKKFIERNDNSGRGVITRIDFMKFYTDSCRSKPGPVRQNIKACGYKEDLTKKESGCEENLEKEDLAAWHLNKNLDIIQNLFVLIDRKDEISGLTWDLLNRLPPASTILEKILNFQGLTEDQASWSNLIENTSPYKTKYYLYILDFLMTEGTEGNQADLSPYVKKKESSEEEEEFDQSTFKKEWRTQFIKKGGFQHLITILMSYINNGIDRKIQVSLFFFILKIFKSFILASVTINKPHLYRNISYIKLANSAFKYLKEEEKEERNEKIGITEEETKPEEKVNEEEDEDKYAGVQDNIPEHMIPLAPAVNSPYVGYGSNNGQMVGPQLPSYYSKNQQKEKKASPSKLKKRIKESLKPRPDFIQFRESLKSELGDNPIKNIERLSLLKLLVDLSVDILSKGNFDLEEVSLVEFSLSISLSLLLADQDFLDKSILTDEIKLLPEDSPIKIEGCSDLVSYLMFGLLAKKLIFIRYFNHGFTILMREAHNLQIQKLLLQIILKNILDDENTGREVAKYIEIACPLLEEICSETKDEKLLLGKEDINDIINIETLFFKILGLLLTDEETNEEEDVKKHHHELIAGYFMILQRILDIEPSIQDKVAQKKEGIVKRIFSECLFAVGRSVTTQNDRIVKCTNKVTRGAAYQFLVALCKDSMQNRQELLENGLLELCEKLPVINSWTYKPVNGKKSSLDFVGIYNLQCICYMNAMLQQFYMTPAFRYGILAANDYQELNIVEDKGRKIDDNLFHQLQRMFGYLDSSDRKDYNPKDFCFSFKDFSGNPVNVALQQDTQEFLNRIFDKLDNALKPTPFRGLMESVYGGKTCQVMVCSGCGYTRTRSELFYNLSLEVKNHKTIEEGFEKLITSDIISDYKCNNCQTKCDVSKTCYLNELPNVFIIHLQRLIFDLEVLMNVKINTRYAFPLSLNVKPYTLHKYEEDQAEANKDKTEEELEAEKKKMEDYLEDNEDKEELLEEQRKFAKAVHYSDDYYDYDLTGVVVHSGNAEFGHYYSFINVNRGDPARVKYNKDKWIEFNDSDIRNFKVTNLEDETFGKGNTIEKEDEFDYMNFAKFDKISSNKNAYILVYEKRKKKPLKFSFDDKNLKEKDFILENLIDEKHRDAAVFKSDEKKGEHTLEVDYFSIKKYIPPDLNSQIQSDNFQFMIEQHVYSKEFLTFVTGVCNFKEIPDFEAQKLPTRIYEGEVSDELKVVLNSILKMQLNLYRDIVSRTSDNGCIDNFTRNMMKILSIAPEASYYVIKEHFFKNIHKLFGLIVSCPDGRVKFNTVCLLTHCILVCINHFKLDMSVKLDPKEDESTEEFLAQKSKVILSLLKKLLDSIFNKKNRTYYTKLGPFFKIWFKLAKGNEQLTVWFIQDLQLIHKFINYYMTKKGSNFEKSFFRHEKVMDSILKTVAYLTGFIKTESVKPAPKCLLSAPDSKAFYKIEFFDKIMKENYIFNSYDSLKKMIKIVCRDNLYFSRVIITMCLKLLNSYTDSVVSGLETLKELCLIDDNLKAQRREMILGIPIIMTTSDYQGRKKFGIQCEGHMNKPMYDFYTPLQGTKTYFSSLLKRMVNMRDKSETNCVLMIAYLLQIVNSSKECFEHILACPSPFALFANFYDWIFVMVNEYVKGAFRTTTYASSYTTIPVVHHYNATLKEELIIFEENIRAYIMSKYPEANEEEYTLITVPTTMIYPVKDTANAPPIEVCQLGSKPIFSLMKFPIIGACTEEANIEEHAIYELEEKKLILKVSELKLNVAESKPNGESNDSIPKSALYKNLISQREIPEGSQFRKFYALEGNYTNKPKPTDKKNSAAYLDYNDHEKHLEAAADMKTAGGLKMKIPKNLKLTVDYNNEGDEEGEVETQNIGTGQGLIKYNLTQEVDLVENKSNKKIKGEVTETETGVETGANEAEVEAEAEGEAESDGEDYSCEEESDSDEVEDSSNFEIEFTNQTYCLKLALTNITESCVACAFKLVPKKNCNVFLPATNINFNITSPKIDEAFLHLLKINPDLPFGDFEIHVLFQEIGDQEFFKKKYMNFAPGSDPLIINIVRSEETSTQADTEPEVEEVNAEEDENTGDSN